MKSAIDVARYFLCRVDREAGDTISLLKLQKLVILRASLEFSI